MKKITLFIAFTFLFIIKSNAQVSSYSFAQSDGSYSEFTDGTVLGTATGNAVGAPSLDSEVYMVTLPFSFIFNGASYSSCNVSSNGYITFGATAPTTSLSTPISSTVAYNGSISAWGGDLNALFELGGLTGNIQWKEIGTAPNREFVVQYRNFRPAYTTSTTLAPYINFQIRLSETTNLIKLVYGSTGLAVGTTNSSTTKQIGLRGATNTDFKNRTNATTVLFVSSTAGTLNTNTQAYSSVNATPGVPSNGLTYTWTPPTCLAPLSTAVSNITTTTATISWLATATVPSGGYEYYYSTSNVAPTGAGTATSNVTENLTDLSDSSNYFLWVRSNCGSGDYSGWVGPVSFATLCVSATSFSQNFDGVAATAFPVCWGKVGTAGTTNLQTTSPNSAPNTLYIYSSSATSQAVVKMQPVSNLGTGTHRLKMQMRANFTVGGIVEIGYLTDVTDGASFVSLGSVTVSSLTYQPYIFVPAAGTYTDHLAFRHSGVPANSLLIDDVVWEVIPTCIEPTSVSVSSITATTASVAWTASVTPPTNGYDYYYSTSNVAPTAGTIPSGSVGAGITTVNLSGLTASLTYYVWVRSKCTGSDLSSWSTVVSFTSSCYSATVPYSQDFESSAVPAMPGCTTIENAGTGNNWTTVSNPGYGFATKTLRYSWNGSNAANAWFYTQAITLTAGTNYNVSYKYGNNSTTYVEKLKVAYGTTSTSTGMTTILADHSSITGGTTTSTAIQNTVTFTPAVSGDYYFGFNAYSIANQFHLYVDDIVITETLGTNSFDNANFSYYPNPVKNTLNLSYTQNISDVAVYNLLGQQVMAKAINANQSQIDMSHLSRGTYMVKVTADNQVKTIKVIKE